ncbi:MAG: hypothetical protein JWP09_126 [Candidatus Taylorbacteria bacterium]|nr:hypothetical protein [Candidatus Taylorbacteria bacterium]
MKTAYISILLIVALSTQAVADTSYLKIIKETPYSPTVIFGKTLMDGGVNTSAQGLASAGEPGAEALTKWERANPDKEIVAVTAHSASSNNDSTFVLYGFWITWKSRVK